MAKPKFTEHTEPVLDILGHQIHVGDYIAYGSMKCDSAHLKVGRVRAIRDSHSEWSPPQLQIQVQGIEDWSWQGGPKAGKLGNLLYPDRAVVLDPARVPDKYKDLLKEAGLKL